MATTAVQQPRSATSKTESYVDNKRKEDIRHANIAAVVRTSLGPKGMDTMISTASNEVIITNDGATILNKMEVLQSAAKMLVELSKSQDIVAGDDTTTVVAVADALLKQCQTLLSSRIHPTVISNSLHKASQKVVDVFNVIAVPVELTDRNSLVKSASTSLNSKVVSQYSTLLAPLAVDVVLSVVDPAEPDLVDLRDVKIVKKLGGTVGFVFKGKWSTNVENKQVPPTTRTVELMGFSRHTIGGEGISVITFLHRK